MYLHPASNVQVLWLVVDQVVRVRYFSLDHPVSLQVAASYDTCMGGRRGKGVGHYTGCVEGKFQRQNISLFSPGFILEEIWEFYYFDSILR